MKTTLNTTATGLKPNWHKPLLRWYFNNDRPLPWRILWKKTKSPYYVWVSEIMLQQTTIATVTPIFNRFVKKFPTVTKLAKASEQDLIEAVRGLGYYRRFRFLHEAAQQLALKPAKHRWPATYEEWLDIPGIGPYTAAALSSICLQESKVVVDGNVERVVARLTNTVLPVGSRELKKLSYDFLIDLIPKKSPGCFNQGMMELGQLLCRPTTAECPRCPLKNKCLAYKNDSQQLCPSPKKKVEKQSLFVHLTAFENSQGQLGLVMRDADTKLLKNTLGFSTEIFTQSPQKAPIALGKFSHSITKYKISVNVYLKKTRSKNNIYWFNRDEIDKKLIANLDRKALRFLN